MLRHQAKIAIVGAFALVLAAYVALAMTDANAQQTTPSPSASPMASPIASPVASPVAVQQPQTTQTVTMVDIAFQPPQLTIPANSAVTINLMNNGAAVHNFNVDELNVHSGDVQPGTQGSVTINAAPGTYTYYCNIPGHKEAGMVGQLTVQ